MDLVDVLGVFGNNGVYVANFHEAVKGFFAPAFQMYQNFDGKLNTYGDTCVAAVSPSAADYSIYASVDSKSSKLLHIMLINKKSTESAITFKITQIKIQTLFILIILSSCLSTRRPMQHFSGASFPR